MPEYITRLDGGELNHGIMVCGACGGCDTIVTYCRAFGGLEEIERRCACGNMIKIETKEVQRDARETCKGL